MLLRQGCGLVLGAILVACASADGTSATAGEGVSTVAQAFVADGACAMPDPDFTPGMLCTADDRNFDGYRYAEQVPHCARRVSKGEKGVIGVHYGVAKEDYGAYEFDHRIPLGLGGTNDIHNIWPQPIEQALEKDKLEQALFDAIQAGTVTQADAVRQLLDWRPPGCAIGASPRLPVATPVAEPGDQARGDQGRGDQDDGLELGEGSASAFER